MLKLKINKPGIFFSIDKLGSFHSPFELRFADSLKGLVEMELTKNGIRNYSFETDTPVTKVKQELVKERKSSITEVKKESGKEVENKNLTLTEVLKRLDAIQLVVNRILTKETTIREVIIQRGEPGLAMIKQPEIEEQEIFIPRPSERISIIDLSVKSSEKDDISDQVESLSNLKNKGDGRWKKPKK